MKTLTALLTQQDKIPVPRFEQKQRVWCGPAALQSMLAFNKCFVMQEEIVNFVNLDEGCYIQDLGAFALSKGFNVEVFSYDMIYLDPTWSSLSNNDLIERMNARLHHVKSSKSSSANFKSLINYVSNGGKLSISLPKKEQIISLLQENKPILAIVNSNSLYDRARLDYNGKTNDVTGTVGGHFLVIVGHKNGYFFVIDPSYENPISVVQEDRFMFSLSLWGGWMMVINEAA